MRLCDGRKLIVRRWGIMVRQASACLMFESTRLEVSQLDRPDIVLSQGSVLAIGAAAFWLALRGM